MRAPWQQWRRICYEIRWWRWYLFTGEWPLRTLYRGPWYLDRDSRRVIIERIEREKLANEPTFDGTYPNRRGQQ